MDKAEPFLFSCHPLKRQEDTASHRERTKIRDRDWVEEGKEDVGPTRSARTDWPLVATWTTRVDRGRPIITAGGSDWAASGLPEPLAGSPEQKPWRRESEGSRCFRRHRWAQPPLRRAVTQHYIKDQPPTRHFPLGFLSRSWQFFSPAPPPSPSADLASALLIGDPRHFLFFFFLISFLIFILKLKGN